MHLAAILSEIPVCKVHVVVNSAEADVRMSLLKSLLTNQSIYTARRQISVAPFLKTCLFLHVSQNYGIV